MAACQWGDCHFHAGAPEWNNNRYLGAWTENGEPGREGYVFRILYKLGVIRLTISLLRRELEARTGSHIRPHMKFKKGFPPLQWRGALRTTLHKNKMEVGRTEQARGYPLAQRERHLVRNGVN